MNSICRIDITFDINQYNTNPAGNITKNTENMTGIHNIIFCCIGSVVGDGDNFCMVNIDKPNNAGNM